GGIFESPQVPGLIEQAQLVGDLTDSEADLLAVGLCVPLAERKLEAVEFLLAVPVWPPEARTLDNELGEFSRGQLHAAPAGRNREGFRDVGLVEAGFERALHGRRGCVLKRD